MCAKKANICLADFNNHTDQMLQINDLFNRPTEKSESFR